MPEADALDDEQANEVVTLLVRVYEIHEVIIAETGGLPGLHDAGLLHAAEAVSHRVAPPTAQQRIEDETNSLIPSFVVVPGRTQPESFLGWFLIACERPVSIDTLPDHPYNPLNFGG